MYLIKRTDQGGGYLAKAGHSSSYVKNLEYARKFPTIKDAERDLCVENEVIVDIERIFDRIRYFNP